MNENLFIDRAKKLFPVMFEGRTSDECWIWNGRITWSTKVEDGRIVNTVLRRIAYVAFRGEIPTYHEVKTACKHSGCVNPNHLTTKISLRQMSKGIDNK
jgi:hypothetical protein